MSDLKKSRFYLEMKNSNININFILCYLSVGLSEKIELSNYLSGNKKEEKTDLLDKIKSSNKGFIKSEKFKKLCYKLNDFTGQINQGYRKINYYSEFPNLVINSKSFEYDFELTSKDLFKKIFDKDYFLIVFPESVKDKKNKDIWYLGGPFYRKYPFTIDLDAKTIGFYLNKKDINNKINDSENIKNKENNSDKNKITNDNNSKIKTILIRIFEISIGIGIVILAYYIGMKVKEGRKKRANELKDDSYEYISDDNKDINEFGNETKKKQLVEMNSKLGL